MSSCPQRGEISTFLFNVLICGNSLKLDDFLNVDPLTCVSVACPALIKSCGVN